MNDRISLSHGSGGGKTRELVETIFAKHFSNPILDRMDDSAVIDIDSKRLAFTTDSFVVKPIFFEGGDIGKLAICGTVNDLAVMGAKPIAVTTAFIIEEGFELELLGKIVRSMKGAADEAGITIAAGDTKVVEKGSTDGIYINTSGIGTLPEDIEIGGAFAQPGDIIIVNGSIGKHGASIITSREEFEFKTRVNSDVCVLNGLIKEMLEAVPGIHVMRDATRGGLATVLNEIAIQSGVSIEVLEESIPVDDNVSGVCGLLGFDPLYLANEGRVVTFVKQENAQKLVSVMKEHNYGKDSCIIGRVVDKNAQPMVTLKTTGKGTRTLNILSGEPLPRIC